MKYIFYIFLFSFFPFCLFGCSYQLIDCNTETGSEFTIIIDAGHGGMDSGTSANDGTAEKEINLAISKKLNNILIASGYKTLMLRNDDELIGDNSLSTIRARKISDIKKRLEIVRTYPDSLLVSIHQNHYSVEKYYGAQVFYSDNSPLSSEYAQSVQQSFKSLIQPENIRNIKAVGSEIYLLYNCNSPAIMVECGFMSNLKESELLKNEAYQLKVSMAIMNGIINCLE